MLQKLNSALHSITPHIADATNGAMNKIGLLSVTAGGTNAIVTEAVTNQSPSWESVSNSIALISAIGGVMFIVNIIWGMVLSRREDKRKQQRLDWEAQDREGNE